MPDPCHTPAQLRLDPGLSTPRVALIAPDLLQPGKRLLDPLQQQGGSGPVLDSSAVDLGPLEQPLDIHQQVPHAPTQLLGPVIAPDAPTPVILTD